MSADFLAHGVTLTFAWFVAISTALCAVTAGAAALPAPAALKLSARFWMSLRLAPSVVAGVFAVALFVPSYWRFEPREAVEGFDVTLTLTAVAGAVIVLASAIRGVSAWLTAHRRVTHWMAHARRMTIAATALPAYAVDAEQPMIALVGLLRPRLLITRGLIEALSPAELEAAVAHELGHQRAFDNFKRLAMCAAPDLLAYFHSARVIERRWAAAAEHVADRISGPNTAARCALASALVKVARLMPATVGATEPISTLIGGGEIASRVQRLLSDDETAPVRRRRAAAVAALAAAVVTVTTAYAPVLRSVHEVTELLVNALP